MKKSIKRIIGIIFILVLGYQQYAYADTYYAYGLGREYIDIVVLITFIGFIVLMTSVISYLKLKLSLKKEKIGKDKEKLADSIAEQMKIEKNKMKIRLYIWIIIFSIMVDVYSTLKYYFPSIMFYIPIILFVLSIIFRFKKYIKVSNIICAISVVLICGVTLWFFTLDKMAKNYNQQFLNYIVEEYTGLDSCLGDEYYTSNIEELINSAINNNGDNDRKITIKYETTTYTSVNELSELLQEININKKYSVDIEYDYNTNCEITKFIKSITLSEYIEKYMQELYGYGVGGTVTGKYVKKAIGDLPEIESRYENVKFNILYTSDINQTTIVNVSDENMQEITNLISEISDDKKYKLEMQNEIGECTLLITSVK